MERVPFPAESCTLSAVWVGAGVRGIVLVVATLYPLADYLHRGDGGLAGERAGGCVVGGRISMSALQAKVWCAGTSQRRYESDAGNLR